MITRHYDHRFPLKLVPSNFTDQIFNKKQLIAAEMGERETDEENEKKINRTRENHNKRK